MINISRSSRQPHREPWTLDCLVHEWSIALGLTIDNSTHLTYTSALNSYLTFCKIHNFPIEPTEETFSFFIVYMSTHIKPDSVNSYLSGICNQLEPFFPDVRKRRASILVSRTLAGCRHRFGTPIHRKQPLSKTDLETVICQSFLIYVTTGCSRLQQIQSHWAIRTSFNQRVVGWKRHFNQVQTEFQPYCMSTIILV